MKRGMTRREREVTDIEEIKKILDKCGFLHLGLSDGDEPYVVPMNYGYILEDGILTIYLHGATKGYKIDVINKNPKVFFEMECDVKPFRGKVACQYGTSYCSVMGSGKAEIVLDPAEKVTGLKTFMKTQTGKDFDINEKLVSGVNIIKITCGDYTAKYRPVPEGAEI